MLDKPGLGKMFCIINKLKCCQCLDGMLLPHYPEVGGSYIGAGKNDSTEIVIYYYLDISTRTAVPQLLTDVASVVKQANGW